MRRILWITAALAAAVAASEDGSLGTITSISELSVESTSALNLSVDAPTPTTWVPQMVGPLPTPTPSDPVLDSELPTEISTPAPTPSKPAIDEVVASMALPEPTELDTPTPSGTGISESSTPDPTTLDEITSPKPTLKVLTPTPTTEETTGPVVLDPFEIVSTTSTAPPTPALLTMKPIVSESSTTDPTIPMTPKPTTPEPATPEPTIPKPTTSESATPEPTLPEQAFVPTAEPPMSDPSSAEPTAPKPTFPEDPTPVPPTSEVVTILPAVQDSSTPVPNDPTIPTPTTPETTTQEPPAPEPTRMAAFTELEPTTEVSPPTPTPTTPKPIVDRPELIVPTPTPSSTAELNISVPILSKDPTYHSAEPSNPQVTSSGSLIAPEPATGLQSPPEGTTGEPTATDHLLLRSPTPTAGTGTVEAQPTPPTPERRQDRTTTPEEPITVPSEPTTERSSTTPTATVLEPIIVDEMPTVVENPTPVPTTKTPPFEEPLAVTSEVPVKEFSPATVPPTSLSPYERFNPWLANTVAPVDASAKIIQSDPATPRSTNVGSLDAVEPSPTPVASDLYPVTSTPPVHPKESTPTVSPNVESPSPISATLRPASVPSPGPSAPLINAVQETELLDTKPPFVEVQPTQGSSHSQNPRGADSSSGTAASDTPSETAVPERAYTTPSSLGASDITTTKPQPSDRLGDPASDLVFSSERTSSPIDWAAYDTAPFPIDSAIPDDVATEGSIPTNEGAMTRANRLTNDEDSGERSADLTVALVVGLVSGCGVVIGVVLAIEIYVRQSRRRHIQRCEIEQPIMAI